MADKSRAINRVFTSKVMCELMQNGQSDVFDYVVKRYIDDPESKSNGQLISEIYAHLSKEQRNEYYYMNTLLNKLLCGIHNVNTTTAFSQVRIGHSIADFVMINGEGRVYEIKSDLDNFNRLYNQIEDYYRAFSKVSVLASIHELEKVREVLSTFGDMGEAVGIYVLSERGTIFNKERSREPKEYNELLEHSTIFKLLRRGEYEAIVESFFGTAPQVEPVFRFKAFLEKFKEKPILEAQQRAFQELKKRNRITVEEFQEIQPELKAVIYFSGLTRKCQSLIKCLKHNIGGNGMYYPYFRGRQYEMLALKELATKKLISPSVVPVIEPVKFIPALNNSLAAFQEMSLPVALVVNPSVGDLTSEPQIIEQLFDKYASAPNVISAILINESAEAGITKLNDKGISTKEILTVLDDPDSLKSYQTLFPQMPKYTLCPYDRHIRRVVNIIASFLKTSLTRRIEMLITQKMSFSPMTILIISRMITLVLETILLLAAIISNPGLLHMQWQFILCTLQKTIL